MSELRDCDCIRDVRKMLRTLPTTFREMYDSILSRLTEGQRTRVLELLKWLGLSFWPLRFEELAETGIVVLEEVTSKWLSAYDEEGRLERNVILSRYSSLVTLHDGRRLLAPYTHESHYDF